MDNREKQIEIPKDEMGMSGYSKLAWKFWHDIKLPMTQCVAIDRVVRKEGYRKQSEVARKIIGEILSNHTPDIDGFFTMHESELVELKKKYTEE